MNGFLTVIKIVQGTQNCKRDFKIRFVNEKKKKKNTINLHDYAIGYDV